MYPKPVYVGTFDPIKAADIVDLYLDIEADLETGEAISSATFAVKDGTGATVPGVVGSHSETDARTDVRVTAPAAGGYLLTAVFTISDGQQYTRIANLVVV